MDETGILKNDLHKAILITALSPFVVYPSVEWPRSITLFDAILLASSYFLCRFFKNRRPAPQRP
ncbi:MAG: hypothetical protein N3F08_03530 [Crenarchaeota archaeon]|nr:hypothetical protein [Thermoproteota archaeon]